VWDGEGDEEGRSARRARFFGREEGPSAREKGTYWEQRGQRREEPAAAEAEAGGRATMQGPQREWPHERTRGTTEVASNGERHTGHSGGSASEISLLDAYTDIIVPTTLAIYLIIFNPKVSNCSLFYQALSCNFVFIHNLEQYSTCIDVNFK